MYTEGKPHNPLIPPSYASFHPGFPHQARLLSGEGRGLDSRYHKPYRALLHHPEPERFLCPPSDRLAQLAYISTAAHRSSRRYPGMDDVRIPECRFQAAAGIPPRSALDRDRKISAHHTETLRRAEPD